jgi:hypothetical protein
VSKGEEEEETYCRAEMVPLILRVSATATAPASPIPLPLKLSQSYQKKRQRREGRSGRLLQSGDGAVDQKSLCQSHSAIRADVIFHETERERKRVSQHERESQRAERMLTPDR